LRQSDHSTACETTRRHIPEDAIAPVSIASSHTDRASDVCQSQRLLPRHHYQHRYREVLWEFLHHFARPMYKIEALLEIPDWFSISCNERSCGDPPPCRVTCEPALGKRSFPGVGYDKTASLHPLWGRRRHPLVACTCLASFPVQRHETSRTVTANPSPRASWLQQAFRYLESQL
jgi:hypothetical protein